MENNINLENLAGGAFAERTKDAIKEVMQNIADLNTDYKAKRKVTLDITFSTKEDREIIECDVIAKVKLAPKSSIHTKFLLDKTLDGEVLANEFKKQLNGQTFMKVDSETGEILSENPQETAEDESTQGLKLVK